MYKFYLILPLLLIISCSKQVRYQETCFYNDSSSNVYIYKIEGVGIDLAVKSPQSVYKGILHADQRASYATTGNIQVKLPITIHYGSKEKEDKADVKKQTIHFLKGIPVKPNEGEAILAFIFGKDLKWHLRWVEGQSHLTISELKSLY